MNLLRHGTLLTALISVSAVHGMDGDQLIAKLEQVESGLGPVSFKSVITEDPPTKIGPGPDKIGSKGTFDVVFQGKLAKWKQYFSEEDMKPLRGARHVVWERRPDALLWYEVGKAGPLQGPGVGRFDARCDNETPLVGRAYHGQWLSALIKDLRGVRVSTFGANIVAQGEFMPGLTFVITFDPAKGWLATHGELRNAKDPDGLYQWTVQQAVEREGNWYVTEAEASFKTKPDDSFAGIRRWTFTHTDLATGKDAKLGGFPKPVAGTLVSGPGSTTWKLSPDGKLDYLLKRERPQRSVWTWNVVFVLSASALLLGSITWLVLSRRRLPSSA